VRARHPARLPVAILVALSSVLGAPLGAQFRGDSTRADLRRFLGDVWSVWSAPAHARARDLEGLGAVATLTAASVPGDERMYRWMQNNPKAWPMRLLHPIRESAHFPLYELGSGQYLLPLSALLYISGLAGHSRGLREAGLGCATAHIASAGTRDVVYALVARDRPRESPEDAFRLRFPGTRNWNKHSFFSGHIGNAMGCASFFGHTYSLGVVEPTMYGFVLAIGAGRMADGRHWASDTVIGALFGFAVGKQVSARIRSRAASAVGPQPPLTIRWSIDFH
jgi:hypothetical protein